MSEGAKIISSVWKPDKVTKMEQVTDAEGNKLYEEDGMTPKMEQKEEDSPFTGSLVLRVPSFTDRLGYMKKVGMGAKGSDIDQLRLIEIGMSHIISVDLQRKSDGKNFNSVEHLNYDKDGADVLSAVAQDIIGGISLGENLIQS